MLSLVLAAALGTAVSSAVAPPADLRVIRSMRRHARFVQVRADVVVAGVRGTGTSIYDLATGRSAGRVAAGTLSSASGFDGVRVWNADVTGMAQIEGNPDLRHDAVAWAHFFGRRGPERPIVQPARRTPEIITLRLQYPGLSGAIGVALRRSNGHVETITDDRGFNRTVARFRDYRRVADVVLPFAIDTVDSFTTVSERVRSVVVLDHVSPNAFAPPAPPDDARLDGITSVRMGPGDSRPIVPIQIDRGPVLHVFFDTGATNYLTPQTARRLGLRLTGRDHSGGVGPGLVAQQYAVARRLRIGAAELRDQPFSVVDDTSMKPGVDGSIGCEVLQRFAVRFDFARRAVDLTRDPKRFGISAKAIPLRMTACTPEIDGALDGVPGAFAIDTGSATALDVMAPFVRDHDLVRRYHAVGPFPNGRGIGGGTTGYFALARSLRLGNVVERDLPIELSAMTNGAFNDPTELGNVGVPILRRYVTVIDYRSGRLWLLR